MKQLQLIGYQGNSLREAFGKHLTELSKKNKKIIVLDADIAGGTGAHHFRSKFKKRFIQCGIAEQNMVSMASALAKLGYIPFVTTFAVFLLRAIEQTRLSIAYGKANVKLIASHPGLDVGPDGASAQCLEDLACFRSIPNMVVLSPCDEIEMKEMLKTVIKYKGPIYLRTGRSPAPIVFTKKFKFKIGKGQIIRFEKKAIVTVISCGIMTSRALKAAEILKNKNIGLNVVNMSSIKPIDEKLILKLSKITNKFITAEDHNVLGGLGSAVSEIISKNNLNVKQVFVGVKDTFGESGEPAELAKKYKISETDICSAAKKLLSK
jgi:transketolase